MRITVNGDSFEIPETQTLADLVETLGLGTGPCAIERNKAVVPHTDHETTRLSDGDSIEIVTLVGGG